MDNCFARLSMLTLVDLLFAKIRQLFSQFLQPAQVTDNTSYYAVSPLNAPTRRLKRVRGRMQNGDDSQALRESTRFCSRQYMQPSHNLRSERHGQLTQRLSDILPAYLVVQHMLDAVLDSDQTVQRAGSTRNQQRLTIQRRKKNNSFLRFLPYRNFKGGRCQSVSLPPQAPDSVSRSCSGPDADPGYPESNNGDSNCGPSSPRRQSVPPHNAVVFPKRTAAKNSVNPAQALTPQGLAAFCHDLDRVADPMTGPKAQARRDVLMLVMKCRARPHGRGCWFAFNAAQRARIRTTAQLPAAPRAPALPAQLDLFA